MSRNYQKYCRPLTAKLMNLLRLDRSYVGGEGNWLFLQEDEQQVPILDMVGGYGANLFGHQNPRLQNAAVQALQIPNHTQYSVRQQAGKTAALLSLMLESETGVAHWITTFSNSGAEAVEAALKHCLIFYQHRVMQIQLKLNRDFNGARLAEAQMPIREKIEAFQVLTNKLVELGIAHPALNAAKTLRELIEAIDSVNQEALRLPPRLLALEGAFHGKTMGALGLTQNQKYREAFYLDDSGFATDFVPFNDVEFMRSRIQETQCKLLKLQFDHDRADIKVVWFSSYAGAFIEPIQGEAGIRELSEEFLKVLRELTLKNDILLVHDEIQAGLYRTGKMCSGHPYGADIYCFAKGLGAGIAKLGATAIHPKRYIPEFGYLHTSTFAEDAFSSSIGHEALQILIESQEAIAASMSLASRWKEQLSTLAAKFPSVVKEVRGRGWLLAIEFQPELRDACYEFKVFGDHSMLGHVFSSALLHNERLRIAPSLSNPLTLRLEPSLWTTESECEYALKAVHNVCDAIEKRNWNYLFSHVLDGLSMLSEPQHIESGVLKYGKGENPCAVFLNHPIDNKHIREMFPNLKDVPDSDIESGLMSFFPLMEFEIYNREVLTGENGTEIDVVMMSFPLTSKLMMEIWRSPDSYLLQQKIQNAVDYAASIGATTVGLGQFTSIVSWNGMVLNHRGMNLTTGNAFTVALSIEAAIKACLSNGVRTEDLHVGCVGAAGNIISVTSSLLIETCRQLTMFYHADATESLKLRETLFAMLQEVKRSPAEFSESVCWNRLREQMRLFPLETERDVIGFLALEGVREVLRVEKDLHQLIHCDLIFSGTNSSEVMITAEMIKEQAIIVDLAVPPNVDPEIARLKKDVVLIQGGIAEMPRHPKRIHRVQMPAFPLKAGESFACMAETFTLSLVQRKDAIHIGSVTKRQVKEIAGHAREAGFRLRNYKVIRSL